MKKHWYLVLMINLLPILANGQGAYYATDTSISAGIKLIDGGDIINSRICQVKKGKEVIKYSPDEISEYGFKYGRVYVSKEIQISDTTQRVFLERLHKGKTTLYYYKVKGSKTFFLEKDSALLNEIPKSTNNDISYRKKLLVITSDCSNVFDATKLVNYNKRSLSRLISRYNNCELKPFPHFRYGLTIGYEFTKLIPTTNNEIENINYFDFKYEGGFTVGLFVDKPIMVSDFSLHAGFYYSRHGFSYNKFIEDKDLDFVANISTLKLPILIRYSYPSNKIRPFINIGGIISFNIRNESLLMETTITGNIIEINDTGESSLINDNQAGYVVGGGVEYKLNFNNSLFFEIRYNKRYGLSDPKSFKISELTLITGINF